MVYITPSDLGWIPCYKSWMQNFIRPRLTDEQSSFLDNLFRMFIDLGFEKLSKQRHSEILATTPM